MTNSFRADQSDVLVADTTSMAWVSPYEGFAVKVLKVSPETGCYTMMFKGEGGRTEPRHRHLAGADIYIVSGAVEYRPGCIARAGAWMYEPAGALHAETRYVEDTIGFAVVYGAIAALDAADNVVGIFDWNDARALLEAH